MPLNLLRRFARSLSPAAARAPAVRARPRPFVPAVTALEERCVPATFAVTNLLDTLNPGSLRYAVARAEAIPGADTVRFADGLSGAVTLGSQIGLSTDVQIDGSHARVTVSGGGAPVSSP